MGFSLTGKNGHSAKDLIDVEFDGDEEVSEIQSFIMKYIATRDPNDRVPFKELRPMEQKLIEGMNEYPENCRSVVKVVNANELRQFIQNAKMYFGNDGNYNWIDVSDITSLTCLFKGWATFNGDITMWDTSNVVNMNDTFNGCASFDRDLSGWDLSNVRFASNCFKGTMFASNENTKKMLLNKLTSLAATYKKKSSIFYIF